MIQTLRIRPDLRPSGPGPFESRAVRSVPGRCVKTRRAWKAVKQVTLTKATPGTPPTVRSSVAFRLRIKRGTKLRVVLSAAQAGACYAAGQSAAIKA